MNSWLPRTAFTRQLWPASRLRSGICCKSSRRFAWSIPLSPMSLSPGACSCPQASVAVLPVCRREASWGPDWQELLKGFVEGIFIWGRFWLSWFHVCFEASQMRDFWGGVSCLLRNSFPLIHFLSHSRERVDQVVREKEKLRSDLDKAEKLKSLMASEVDDHHAAIERRNEYNLRCGQKGRGQGPPLTFPTLHFPSTPIQGRVGTELGTTSDQRGTAQPPGRKAEHFEASSRCASISRFGIVTYCPPGGSNGHLLICPPS